jgi:hypothetical protein
LATLGLIVGTLLLPPEIRPEPPPPHPGDKAIAQKSAAKLARIHRAGSPRSGVNLVPESLPGKNLSHPKRAHKTPEAVLLRRWVEMNPRIHGHTVRWEPYADRTLQRLFPNTEFHRLIAQRTPQDTVGYGCVSLGQPLLLPQEMNLLLILENRPLNRHNAQTLAELVVRLADSEGGTTMNVTSKRTVHEEITGDIQSVIVHTWSNISAKHKRWKIDVRRGRLYSLEEKLIGFRALVRGTTDPWTYEGPSTGDEKYVVLWRDARTRDRMRDIRRVWRELRRTEGEVDEP